MKIEFVSVIYGFFVEASCRKEYLYQGLLSLPQITRIQYQYRDTLPVNANLTSDTIADNYIEIVLNSNQQEFYDLRYFALVLKKKLKIPNGSDLGPETKVSLIDEAGYRFFSRCTLFLNGTACESSAYFGLYNTIKTY